MSQRLDRPKSLPAVSGKSCRTLRRRVASQGLTRRLVRELCRRRGMTWRLTSSRCRTRMPAPPARTAPLSRRQSTPRWVASPSPPPPALPRARAHNRVVRVCRKTPHSFKSGSKEVHRIGGRNVAGRPVYAPSSCCKAKVALQACGRPTGAGACACVSSGERRCRCAAGSWATCAPPNQKCHLTPATRAVASCAPAWRHRQGGCTMRGRGVYPR